MIYIGYKSTGQPLGFAASKSAEEAVKNWPGHQVLEFTGKAAPDLSTLWVVAGALVDRDQVIDQAALDAMAAADAETARVQALADLKATDGPFVRTLEDLIQTLIAKGVITSEDLPLPARDKIKAREDLRAKLNA